MEGATFIEVDVDRTAGEVTFTPSPDWNGVEVLTFKAYDDTDSVSDTLEVTVEGVNDAPGPATITGPAGPTTVDQGTAIDFDGACPDPDLPYGDSLKFVWTSNISGVLGEGAKVAGVTVETTRPVRNASPHRARRRRPARLL